MADVSAALRGPHPFGVVRVRDRQHRTVCRNFLCLHTTKGKLWVSRGGCCRQAVVSGIARFSGNIHVIAEQQSYGGARDFIVFLAVIVRDVP